MGMCAFKVKLDLHWRVHTFLKKPFKIPSDSILGIPSFWKGITIVMMILPRNSNPSTDYGICISIIYFLFSHEDG